jgi:hypothetical protein
MRTIRTLLCSRKRLALAALLMAALASAFAYAYLTTTVTTGSNGQGKSGALNAPTNVSASATGGTVSVSWTASTTSGSAPTPQGYYVTRTNTSSQGTSAACGSSKSNLIASGTTCSDTGVTSGTYTYTVTAAYNSWTAQSAASSSVGVTPKITLSPTQGPVGNTDTISGTGFAPGKTLTATFHGTAVTLGGTTTTSVDGRFGGAGYTVPSGASGSNTVTVSDGTNSASGTFTVASGASLSLSPTSGPSGTLVVIQGSGYTAGATLSAKWDGAALALSGQTTVETGGTIHNGVNFTVPSASDGWHTVQVTDGTKTGTATFTVIATAPSSATLVDGSGSTTTIMGTNQGAVNVKVVLPSTSASSDVLHVTLTDGTHTTAEATASATQGTGTVTVSGIDARALNDGSITINAWVSDALGDSSSTRTGSTTKAIAPTNVQLVNGSGTAISSINMLNQTSTNVKVTLPSGARGGDVVHLTLSDGTHTTADQSPTIPADNTTSVTISGIDASALNDGTNNITIRATVEFPTSTGTSTSAAKTGTTSKDTVPPRVSSINDSGSSPTNHTSVSWTVTFSTAVSGVQASDFQVATAGSVGTPTVTSVTGSGSSYTVTVGNIAANGSGTVGLNLTDDDSILDAAGNPLAGPGAGNGNFTGQTYTIDTTAPSPPVIASPANGSYNTTGSVTLTGTAEPSSTVTVYDGATSKGTVPATGGSWTLTLSNVSNGSHTYTATASDAAGNTSGASSSVTVTVDTQAPTVTVASPTNNSYVTNSTPTISGTAGNATTPSSDSTTVTVKVYSGPSATGTPVQTINATRSATSWSTTAATLAEGTYTAQASQQDAAGNTGTSSAVTFTVDATSPFGLTSWSTTNHGSTVGLAQQSDTITLNFSEAIDTSSILSGWTNGTQGQNVWVKIADSGAGTSTNDTLTVCAQQDSTCSTPLPMGGINLKGNYISSSSGTGTALFGSANSGKSQIVGNSQNPTSFTLTLGAGPTLSSGATLQTASTASNAIWSNWSFEDLAGNLANPNASATQATAQKQL